MRTLQSGRHTRARISASIHDMLPRVMLGVVQQCLDPRLHETPRSSIERLLLSPNNCLGVGVHVQVLIELRPGERVELLDAGQGNVFNLVSGTMLVQRSVYLTRAEDHTIDLIRRCNGGAVLWIRDDPAEVRAFGEVFDVGARERVAKKGLGEEEDERWESEQISIAVKSRNDSRLTLPKLTVHLASQKMEVVGRSGTVRNLHVAILVLSVKLFWGREDSRVLVRQLQEALHATGRMLRALSVVTVRQTHHKT